MTFKRVVVSGLVVWLGGAASAFAAFGLTGNPQAIAIARAAVRAYARLRVETYTETGFIEMNDLEGKSSYFNFDWGQTTLARGWVRATEHGIVALSNGHVVWWRDDLAPPPCTGIGACHQIPVELLSERRGAFYAFGNAARHTCFGRLRGKQPVDVGEQWNPQNGHFSAPMFGPGTVKLTYTYPYGKGRTARETDTLSTRTYLLESGRVAIDGRITTRFSSGHPSNAPKLPKVNLCTG